MERVRRELRLSHGPLMVAGAVAIVVNGLTGHGVGPLWITGVVLLLGGLLILGWRMLAQRPPRGVSRVATRTEIPVHGRWTALNGPAVRVPSHTHHLAQSYAIDLVHRPADRSAPPPVWFWPPVRRPGSYPAHGQPLLAPADGVVVTAHDGQRDHLTRASLPGLGLLLLEGFVRSLGRPSHLLGNHLVLDLGGGTFALFAHLRRGSLRVGPGDRFVVGQPLAACGNSGNSSEPHLHYQLMDASDVTVARGLPFSWRYRDDDGAEVEGVPANGTAVQPPPVPDGTAVADGAVADAADTADPAGGTAG